MKSFVIVFLILSSLSVVFSINCNLGASNHLDTCANEMRDKAPDNEALSEFFVCVRKLLLIDELKNIPCPNEATECFTLTYELKDQTEVIFKSCDNSKHDACKATKSRNDKKFDMVTSFIVNEHCEYCSSDNCYTKTPKDKPLPPDASSEKQKKQKNSASLTAVSASLVSAVFITSVLIIHILL